MSPRHAIILVALVLGVSLAAPAFAQDEIERLNEEGITAFQEGNFSEAADKFRQAYELAPEPTLKKNESIAWFKGGNCEKAVHAAETFLMLGVQDEGATKEAESVVARCSVKLAREAIERGELAQAESLLARTQDKVVDDEAKAEIAQAQTELEQARAREAERQRAASAAAQPQETPASTPQTGLGYALTGAGSGVLLVALVYHVAILTSTVPTYRRIGAEGRDYDRYVQLGNRVATARWLVPTLYALGGATAGAGLYFLLSPPEQNTTAGQSTRAPTATLGIYGRF